MIEEKVKHPLDGMTVEDCDAIALTKGGVIGTSNGYIENDITIGDEWTCFIANKTVLLKALTNRSWGILCQGQTSSLMSKGFSKFQADKFVFAKYPFKWQLVDILIQVYKYPEVIQAFDSHPLTYGLGSPQKEWREKHDEVLSLAMIELSELDPQKETSLAKLIYLMKIGE